MARMSPDTIARANAWREHNRQKHRERMMRADFIDIGEFIRITGLARSTIYKLRKKRPLGFPVEYAPTGSKPFFKRQEVVAWMESQPLW